MTGNDLEGAIQEVPVTVWVGKRGLEGVIDELDDQLDTGDPVKVKFLRSAREMADDSVDELAERLAERTRANVVDRRGHVAVLVRR